MDFSVHADRLDAEADNRLGDLIQYSISGAAFVDMKARVFPVEPPQSWKGADEAQGGWRMRINSSLVPQPSRADRIKCARVFGDLQYRPIDKSPTRDGRYWLVDLQKVT